MSRGSFGVPLGLGLLLAWSTAALQADSWPGPVVKEVFSESRDWFVRIVPGTSIGDTVGFAGSPKGPYAKAEFYRRQADRSYRLMTERTLVNPVAPIAFFVTDRGYLATLDNWHNMGVMVDDKGSRLRSDRFAPELQRGSWQFCQSRGGPHLCRTTNADRKWQGYVEPKPRP